MEITKDVRYVGVNDHDIDLFEGQYVVPEGMAYNSYVIVDEKIAVIDTVDRNFTDEWLGNLAGVLGERKPDYLIMQHMDMLEERLRRKGYYCTVNVINQEKKVDFVEDFLKRDLPTAGKLHRYSFDVRA